jgi:putative nucleotidyltransferase with HDIG domain
VTSFAKFLRRPRVVTNLTYCWAGLLCVTASGFIAGLVLRGVGLGESAAVIPLAALALVAERQSIRLNSRTEVSISSLVFVFAAVVFGPLASIVVGGTGLLADLTRRDGDQPTLRWLTWTASRVIVAGAAGLAAVPFGSTQTKSFGVIFGAVAAAALVESVTDVTLGAATTAVRRPGSFRETFRTLTPVVVASVPLHTPVIAVLAYAYKGISPWSVALFVAPAFAAQRLFLLYRQQRESAEALAVANERLERANLSFATALVATLDARDRYTAGHSAAVAIYARDIAARLALSVSEQQLAHLAGLVHDIGKIGLPAGLLEKPGALTLDERRQMEEHSMIGERILRNVDDYAEIAAIVRHHHERFDGNGYPDNLVGEEIPLLARIIAVADAYNAMTSDRPYRDAMPSRVARLRLAQAVETQFDTTVVAAFEAILAGSTEEYRQGIHADFALESASALRPEPRAVAAA